MAKAKTRRFFQAFRKWLFRLILLWFFITLTPILVMRWFNPPTTSFMLAREYSREYDAIEIKQEWRDFSEISPNLAISVIASEDQKFADHWGFDLGAIQQVLADRNAGKKMRGASTISQQLVKNLFLWSSRSWVRKGLEVYFTAAIEVLIPKRRILELYLNVVEFGDGIYGAEAAARSIYGIPAQSLNPQQAAFLAARLPAPKTYSINPPSDHMQQRARWIRQQIIQLGGLSYLESL